MESRKNRVFIILSLATLIAIAMFVPIKSGGEGSPFGAQEAICAMAGPDGCAPKDEWICAVNGQNFADKEPVWGPPS